MSEQKNERGLNISAKSFLIAIGVIFAIMVLAYVLTIFVPGGAYVRTENGIDADSFHVVESGIPFWKWLVSPVLVLGAEGNVTLFAVIAFLLIMGGVFECLTSCGVLRYMLDRITERFRGARYQLMAAIILFFMALGSLVGTFEECVPLVPIVTALALNFGWDVLTGLGMSLLAVGCGFAAGVFNPFTIGVAQTIAGLPMFSGWWMRLIAFVLIYLLLFFFVRSHAKKVEREIPTEALAHRENDPKMNRGMIAFAGILSLGIAAVFCSALIPALQDYTMIVIAVMFLIAGLTASILCGLRGKKLAKRFGSGVVGLLPAVVMILMASSIRYTLEEAHVLDALLHAAVTAAGSMPRWLVLMFLYVIVLILNLFIASGSAKAIMLIPLIMPLAALYNIPAQLCIMAFAFGDGFSNVFYPTNPVLLISLGLVDSNYGEWARWSGKFQLANFLLTAAMLLVGLAVLG